MSWSNHECDDCAERTDGGPCLRDEVWETIALREVVSVPIPRNPDQPFLFHCFNRSKSKRSYASPASSGGSVGSLRRKT
jgi:hypothetical protein